MATSFAFTGSGSHTSIQRYNLSPNPKFAINLNSTSLNQSTSGSSITRLTGTGPIGLTTYVRAQTTAANTYLGIYQEFDMGPIPFGENFTFSAYLRPLTTNTVTGNVYLQFRDDAGTVLATYSTLGVALTQNNFSSNRVSITGSAPIGSTTIRVYARIAGTIVSGDFVDVSALQIEYGTSATTYMDGDTANTVTLTRSWQNAPNNSMSIETMLLYDANRAVVGDLIAGSWSIDESVTPIDMLDSSGSTGGVSATFKNIPQITGSTPTSAPANSSDYTQGQPYTFRHDTLGTVAGSIVDTKPQSSIVQIDGSTPLSILNVSMQMPMYSEGSYFYSFKRIVPDGANTVVGGIKSMCIDSSGNIWVTGGTTGTFGSIKYDRFGNVLMTLSHSYAGQGIVVDSSGYIYVMGQTAGITKYTPAGVSMGLIVSSLPGAVKMTIDQNNYLWIGTTDTTASAALKKYTTGGVFVSSSLTYNPSNSAPGSNTITGYTGMAYINDGTGYIYLGNTYINTGGQQVFEIKRVDPSTGSTIAVTSIGTQGSEWSGMDLDWAPNADADPFGNGIRIFSQTGLYDFRSNYINTAITAPTGAQSVFATDHNGGSYWGAINDTVYRFSGGMMDGNQAIECYLGAAGYRGTITYAANTPYRDTLDDLGKNYPLAFPTWDGNVWTRLKELAARLNRNITTTGTGIRISRNNNRLDSTKLDISNRETPIQINQAQPGAQQIDVTCQNVKVGGMGTGAGGDGVHFLGFLYQPQPTDTLLTVDALGRSAVTIAANVYATSIQPPVPTDEDWFTTLPAIKSKYAVIDSSEPPQRVPANTWTTSGGSMVATPSLDTPGSIDITVIGPTEIPGYTGPFSIGAVLGTTPFAAFKLYGYGMSTDPQTFSVLTGAPFAVKSELSSQSLDSPFLNDMSNAYDAARIAAGHEAGGHVTCSFSLPVTAVNLPLGQIGGSYFYWKRNFWRVTAASVAGGWIDIDAEVDTRIYEVVDGTVTYGQIDAIWTGSRYQDNYLSPGVLNA